MIINLQFFIFTIITTPLKISTGCKLKSTFLLDLTVLTNKKFNHLEVKVVTFFNVVISNTKIIKFESDKHHIIAYISIGFSTLLSFILLSLDFIQRKTNNF